ncbi:hypothetical protein [Prochlorococcus sp. MIT 1307]|uniref:hypothetical protein n=1 Tax=Prochlorococcus sp. MIT 1307 TaxID=3096219 RepID=UPI002A751FA8|nr:hypothetical protein [Prochlorococcus sp. MIT 1307]
MKVPLPEKRRCEECQNLMSLNLYRLNSSTCRYCQDGISIPKRLLDSSILEERKISKDASIDKEIKSIESTVEINEDESSRLIDNDYEQSYLNDEE